MSIITRIFAVMAICLTLLPALCPAYALADSKNEVVNGINNAAGQSGGGDLSQTITTIVNLLSAIAGVTAVIFIIVGGLRYITSAGNAEGAKSAKNTIIYAVIGLIIVALAQLIVYFVIKQTTTATVGQCKNGKIVGGPNNGKSCP
jgi:cytochrome bd-type quinol oxidase subunit 2